MIFLPLWPKYSWCNIRHVLLYTCTITRCQHKHTTNWKTSFLSTSSYLTYKTCIDVIQVVINGHIAINSFYTGQLPERSVFIFTNNIPPWEFMYVMYTELKNVSNGSLPEFGHPDWQYVPWSIKSNTIPLVLPFSKTGNAPVKPTRYHLPVCGILQNKLK